MAADHELTDDDYDNIYNHYEQFYKNTENNINCNGNKKLKELGTDIFYYGDGKHDNIFAKYKPTIDSLNKSKYIVKLKTRNNYLELYEELLKYGDNLYSDNYVIIDVIGLSVSGNNDEDFEDIPQLRTCIEYNIFGIEYMLKRYYAKQKTLHIYNNEFFFKINSYDAFEEIFFEKLIDDLFNPYMYIGEGRGTEDKSANADIFNTNLNIIFRLKMYEVMYSNRIFNFNTQIKISNFKYKPLDPTDNTKRKYIYYTDNTPIKVDAINKKIFIIGDIHGDFARLVQILYNAKFIKFEGVAWNKVNPSDENSYKNYLHSTDIFKEIKWIAQNTVFLFAGDLIDSTGRHLKKNGTQIDADEETGDYELRIHLMIIILRYQAMKDNNSFINFVLGNHDIHNNTTHILKNISSISCNKLFNSKTTRSSILNIFNDFGFKTLYLFINYSEKKNIILTHGSFEIFDYDLDDVLYKNNMFNNSVLNDEIIFFNRNILFNYKLKYDDDLIRVNKTLYEVFNFTYDKLDDLIKNNIITQASLDKYGLNLKLDEIWNGIRQVDNFDTKKVFFDKMQSKYTFYKNDDEFDFKKSYFNEITKILSNKITDNEFNYYVFGHNVIKDKDLGDNSEYQSGYNDRHTILSTCNNHCFFVDTGLSKAFDKGDDTENNNEFYELVYLDSVKLAANDSITNSKLKDRKATAHLRVYTDKNRFKLGSRQAELFYDTEDTKADFTPKLEDIGVPIGDLLLS